MRLPKRHVTYLPEETPGALLAVKASAMLHGFKRREGVSIGNKKRSQANREIGFWKDIPWTVRLCGAPLLQDKRDACGVNLKFAKQNRLYVVLIDTKLRRLDGGKGYPNYTHMAESEKLLPKPSLFYLREMTNRKLD